MTHYRSISADKAPEFIVDFSSDVLGASTFVAADKQEHRLASLITKRVSVEPRHEILPNSGASLDLHIVMQGIAYRNRASRDGSRQIIGLLFPGDACNLDLLFQPEMDHDVTALVRTEVATIPWQKIREQMADDPGLAQTLWRSTVEEAARLRQWLINMGGQKARGRVAHLLYELYIRLQRIEKTNGQSYSMPLTQEEMADILGMTPVHVSRVLKQLREERLIVFAGRELTIADPEGLKAAASFDPRYLQTLGGISLGERLGFL